MAAFRRSPRPSDIHLKNSRPFPPMRIWDFRAETRPLPLIFVGEVVVDLGSGGGLDVFLASKMIGPTGSAIGIDMTPSMIDAPRPKLRGVKRKPWFISSASSAQRSFLNIDKCGTLHSARP